MSIFSTKPAPAPLLRSRDVNLTILICSRVFCSGFLKQKKRMGADEESPVSLDSRVINSASVKVVKPQPVWLKSMMPCRKKARPLLAVSGVKYSTSASRNLLDDGIGDTDGSRQPATTPATGGRSPE